MEPAEVEKMFNDFASWEPTIPDQAVLYYLNKGGLNMDPVDKRVLHAVSASAQSLLTDIINSAAKASELRNAQIKDSTTMKMLTMDDLSVALRQYGINQPYQPFIGSSKEISTVAQKQTEKKQNEEDNV